MLALLAELARQVKMKRGRTLLGIVERRPFEQKEGRRTKAESGVPHAIWRTPHERALAHYHALPSHRQQRR